jgi:hypothetical protein
MYAVILYCKKFQYPERPMVKLTADQVVKTEWDGKWWITKVKEVRQILLFYLIFRFLQE